MVNNRGKVVSMLGYPGATSKTYPQIGNGSLQCKNFFISHASEFIVSLRPL